MHFLVDWRKTRMNGVKNNRLLQVYPRKWSKPPEGWVNINVDAATFNVGFVGIGSIMRDSGGNFLREKCERIEGAWKPGKRKLLV